VLDAAERYRHPFLVRRGTSAEPDEPATEGAGLAVEGDGVVLSALRCRGAWLEARVVAQSRTPTRCTIRGPFDEARDADLLGRALEPLPTEPGVLRLDLRPWEIRTVQLRLLSDPEAGLGGE